MDRAEQQVRLEAVLVRILTELDDEEHQSESLIKLKQNVILQLAAIDGEKCTFETEA